jgi:hypothetical protein
MCGGLANGCNSTNAESAPDALADDGPSPTADGDATGGERDATSVDGTVSDGPSSDGPMPDVMSADAGRADGAVTNGDASDSASADGGIVARLLVPGSNLAVGGITSDGYVIYYDGSTQTYYARPLSGGSATAIYTAPPSAYSGYDFVIGKVAFVWAWNSQYLGTLTTWSSGMPQGVSLTSTGLAYRYQTLWASSDSAHIAYLQSTSSDATVSSLYGANADGTGVTLLLSNIDTNASFQGSYPACFPRLVFRGDSAVVSFCTAADAGLTPEIQSFSISNGWARRGAVPNWVDSRQYNLLDQAPFTFPFAVDPDGGRIAAASASSGNGAVQVFPIDGGAGTVVDPSVALAPSLSFAGSVDSPWSIYYNDDAGALRRAYASNPVPQTLVDASVNYFSALSGDGKWLLVSDTLNAGGWFSDLSLVSTESPGVPVLVASSSQYDGGPITAKAAPSVARGFTTDSAYALATTNLWQNHAGQWVGSLRSMPVTPPTTTRLVAQSVVNFVTLRGSMVLVGDNFQDTDGGSTPTLDIDVVDPSGSGGALNIATGVPGDMAVSSDLTQAAYTVTSGAAPGIYVSTLP